MARPVLLRHCGDTLLHGNSVCNMMPLLECHGLQGRPSFVYVAVHQPPWSSRPSCCALFWAECKNSFTDPRFPTFLSHVQCSHSDHLRTKEPPGKNPTVGVGQTTRRAQPAKYGERCFTGAPVSRRSHPQALRFSHGKRAMQPVQLQSRWVHK